jgi:hypothetical protein
MAIFNFCIKLFKNLNNDVPLVKANAAPAKNERELLTTYNREMFPYPINEVDYTKEKALCY